MRFLVCICAFFSAMAAPLAVDMKPDFGGVATELYGIYEEQENKRADARRAKIGAFYLDADFKAFSSVNSNIYATDESERSDAVTTLRPEVRLSSDWKRHGVSVRGFVSDNRYETYDSEDHTEFGGSVSGRLDVLRGTYITAGGFAEKRFEGRGSPDAAATAVKPTEYTREGGKIKIVHGPGRVRLEASGQLESLDYEDGFTSSGSSIDNSERDRTSVVASLRGAYRVARGYEAYAQGNHVQTTYETVDSALGAKRSSDGYDAIVGVAAKRSKFHGDLYVGVSKRRYDATSLGDVTVPNIGGTVLYRPSGLTSVKVSLKRTFEETTDANAASYVQTAANGRLEHAVMRHFLMGAEISVAQNDYKGGGSEREDDVLIVALDGRYDFNTHLSAHVGYEWASRDSSLAGADYERSQFMSYLRGAF